MEEPSTGENIFGGSLGSDDSSLLGMSISNTSNSGRSDSRFPGR